MIFYSRTLLRSKFCSMQDPGISLLVQWLRLPVPHPGGLGSIPGQGTRSLMLQLRVCMLQLKSHMPQLKKRSCMLQLRPAVAK